MFRRLLFPLSFGLFVSLAVYAASIGLGQATYSIFVFGVLVVVGSFIERAYPHDEQGIDVNRLKSDILVLLFNAGVVAKLGSVVILAGFAWLAENYFGYLDFVPVWAQVVGVVVLVEFLRYWVHRWQHSVPLLWRWHGVHHTVPLTYGVNGLYSHPIDFLLRNVLTLLVPTLLGFDASAILIGTAALVVIGYFAHCNLPLRYGPLEWVFVSPRLHRWHHSERLVESNTNFGIGLILFDRLFGTVLDPKDREGPEKMGVSGVAAAEGSVADMFMAALRRIPDEETPTPDTDAGAAPYTVFLSGGFGMDESILAKYAAVFQALGCEVVCLPNSLPKLFMRRWTLRAGRSMARRMEAEAARGRRLVIGCFSGGYVAYYVALEELRRRGKTHVLEQIEGQVFDSGPFPADHASIDFMASKLGLRFGGSTMLLGLYSMLNLRRPDPEVNWVNDLYAKGLHGALLPRVATLVLFAREDGLILQCMGPFLDMLRRHVGAERLAHKAWDGAVHSSHLRADPVEYTRVCGQFMSSLRSPGRGSVANT